MTRNTEGCLGVLGCLGLAGAILGYGASQIRPPPPPPPAPKIVQKVSHGLVRTVVLSACMREIPWQISLNGKIVQDTDKIARYRYHGTLGMDTMNNSRKVDFYCDVAIDQTVFNPDKTVKELRAHVIKWDVEN